MIYLCIRLGCNSRDKSRSLKGRVTDTAQNAQLVSCVSREFRQGNESVVFRALVFIASNYSVFGGQSNSDDEQKNHPVGGGVGGGF